MVTAPNQLWCMAFKGHFLTGDGYRCDPFTITDVHSRFLVRCQAVARMHLAQVSAVCDAAMREFGMPERIRTDNGAPFAGVGLLGLSKLSPGWLKLGIVHERIQAGRPQQNGRNERMHRTLKEDTAKPLARTVTAQQKKLDRFRLVFNFKRPHEALANEMPRSIYAPSARLLPSSVQAFISEIVSDTASEQQWIHQLVQGPRFRKRGIPQRRDRARTDGRRCARSILLQHRTGRVQ